MNVLVTGASGYIGSLLSKKILEADHNLIFFDLNCSNDSNMDAIINHPRCIIYNGDLRDKLIIKEVLKNCDVVIHLAGISDGRMGKKDPEFTKEINIKATKYLIESSKKAGVKRFIFASTFGVYGNQCFSPFTEDHNLNPVDPYSESKAIGEKILFELSDANFVTCSIRIAMVYGISILTRFDFLVNQLVTIAIKNGEISIVGGDQIRPQVHVQDVSDAFLKLISIDSQLISGKSFNLVSENPSIIELAALISRLLPQTIVNVLPKKINEDSFELDGTKIKNELGLYPKYNLDKGINELIDYIKISTKK